MLVVQSLKGATQADVVEVATYGEVVKRATLADVVEEATYGEVLEEATHEGLKLL